MIESESLVWESEVRDYEVDYQGIVNNANYFHYLDHARAKYLKHYNVDVSQYALDNKHIVLLKTSITFKKSLVYGDIFSVLSKINRISRLKFMFDQKIVLSCNEQIIVVSESIISCVSRNGKPHILQQFENMPIS